MKIVVCDDSIEDLTEIERLLTKYKETNSNINLEVEQFSDAAKLYQKNTGKRIGGHLHIRHDYVGKNRN